MIREEEKRRSQAVLSTLTRIDLYHHSLRLAAHRLIAWVAGEQEIASGAELRERSLELAQECSDVLGSLRDLLTEDEAGLVESAVDRVELALLRASQARDDTLHMVNIWKVVEASDGLLGALGDGYGYVRIASESEGVALDDQKTSRAELARLFAEYEDTMAREPSLAASPGPPFEHGILQWRGNKLYYVQRVEDGARWVELDPDVEPRIVGEEQGGIEIAEARTVDGYPLNLMLDVGLDANVVDEYINSQRGHEYYVSGYQVAAEREARGRRPGRRRR